ncbi:MAG: DUF2853 family protein [Akkermansiaceae bacterium]
MSAEKNIAKSTAQLNDLGVKVNDALLEKIVKGLGIANQSVDASLVSATDPEELKRVEDGFLTKKLGIDDADAKSKAVADVMAQMKGINQKQRGTVYYLLTEKFGKESVYLG